DIEVLEQLEEVLLTGDGDDRDGRAAGDVAGKGAIEAQRPLDVDAVQTVVADLGADEAVDLLGLLRLAGEGRQLLEVGQQRVDRLDPYCERRAGGLFGGRCPRGERDEAESG